MCGLERNEYSEDRKLSLLKSWIEILYWQLTLDFLNLEKRYKSLSGTESRLNGAFFAKHGLDRPTFTLMNPIDSLIRRLSDELPVYGWLWLSLYLFDAQNKIVCRAESVKTTDEFVGLKFVVLSVAMSVALYLIFFLNSLSPVVKGFQVIFSSFCRLYRTKSYFTTVAVGLSFFE